MGLNPKTTHTEFGGVIGAIGITFGLPALITLMYLTCNDKGCPASLSSWELTKQQILLKWPGYEAVFFNFEAWKMYIYWFGLLTVLDRILPGKQLKGIQLRDGSTLDYKINGKLLFTLLCGVFLTRIYNTNGQIPELIVVYENLLSLTGVTIVFSFLLATYCYIASFVPLINSKNGKDTNEKILALGGNTGNFIYDWFIGRELNPRIGNFDIKLFCELNPGLLLWLVIDLALAHHQYLELGKVTDSMIIVLLLQGFYIFDGVLNQEGVISMIDITTDGFGFMLCFGDLAWVPFSYTMQARYLANNPIELGIPSSSAIIGLYAVGYFIFHSANKQKSLFKSNDPSTSNLTYISTPTGSKLITSGWWGMSRHINYFGDWLMALAMCLPTGFNTPLTYFYPIYFATLLLHRQARDEAKCSVKYGKTWKEYCELVPYKIIPYVY